ncbi:hypothetical protein, partial [Cupriavidus sp. 8B]
AQAAVQRNTALGQSILNAPGAVARFGLRAMTGNVSLDEVGQGISQAWQSERINQLEAAGDYAGAQAIRTQNVLSIASLAVGGEGVVAGTADVLTGAARTATMGTRLAAEEFGASRTGQLFAAGMDQAAYRMGLTSYVVPPEF